MRRRVGRRIGVLLTALLAVGSLTGCSLFGNTKIVFTTGLSSSQLFKVGKSVCTLSEAMVYVMDYQERYESAYGVEMWEHDFGGVTLEDYVKDSIVSELASMKAITLLADQYEVTLTQQEETKIGQAAEEYYAQLSKEQIDYMDLELADVESLYRDHVLSKRVYEEITKDVNTEVSDDEARIITVQMIRLDSRENAQNVLNKLEEGRDFASLASAYSKDSQLVYTFGRGEQPAAIEEAAFALETDGVSGIVESEGSYYLIRCTENFDREATEANKTTLVNKRRDESFSQVYEALIADTPSQFNTRAWNKVHFSDWTGEMPPNFLDIYTNYFGE